jgi:predicted transcriptional regulator
VVNISYFGIIGCWVPETSPMPGKSSFSKEYRHFCKLLAAARKTAGLTQQEVAKSLRRPQSYVSKYESGERRLDVIEFLRVARILKVDSGSFLNQISF